MASLFSPIELGDFLPEVQGMLTDAGWSPGRDGLDTVCLPGDVNYPPDVLSLLAEFAGLLVRSSGSGISVARSSIYFDPAQADQESSDDGMLEYFNEKLGITLYPFGYLHGQPLWLCVGSDGKVYLVSDFVICAGTSFTEGINNILLGIKGKSVA